MTHFEIDDCLESMEILVDTREQKTERAAKRYARFGVPYKHCALSYGDYTYNFRLPNGQMIHDISSTIFGHSAVERKMNLDELATCYTRGRKRFEKEFQRAKENGARMYLLVEDANWEKIFNGGYKSRYNSKAFVSSVLAWSARYDLQIMFCKQETSGELIKEILYRELKERLERGEYDCLTEDG